MRVTDLYCNGYEKLCESAPFDAIDELEKEQAEHPEYFEERNKWTDNIVNDLLDRRRSYDEATGFIHDELDLAYSGGFLAGIYIGYKLASQAFKLAKRKQEK